ncbi:MAG TPA: PIN domain-containing protein [Candidatus Deferrimicrobium sp.]|nr:PIN domain-containing protein [Candidatus Deferrimicrobium sp.]
MKLIDTNILVHAYNKDSPNRLKAKTIVEDLIKGKYVISSQNILEFYSAITKRVSNPINSEEAKTKALNLYNSNAKKITPNLKVIENTLKFAAQNKLKGGEIFDALLVSTMLEYKIPIIITENDEHFKNFPIKVENPF